MARHLSPRFTKLAGIASVGFFTLKGIAWLALLAMGWNAAR